MSWGEPLKLKRPPAHIATVTASTRQYQDASVMRMVLFFSVAMRQLLPCETFEAYPGHGPDQGKLRLVFAPDGSIKLSKGKCTLPMFDGLPDSHIFRAELCEVINYQPKNLIMILKLPVDAWEAQIDG